MSSAECARQSVKLPGRVSPPRRQNDILKPGGHLACASDFGGTGIPTTIFTDFAFCELRLWICLPAGRAVSRFSTTTPKIAPSAALQ